MRPSGDGSQDYRPAGPARRASQVAFAAVAVILALLGTVRAASAVDEPSGGPPVIYIGMRLADPTTYDLAAGGGNWADVAGTDNEWQWSNYYCGAVVSHLVHVEVGQNPFYDATARSIEIDMRFDAASDGVGTGAGHTEFVRDPVVLSGTTTATLSNIGYPIAYQAGQALTGTLRLTDLTLGETVIVRIDTRVTCATDIVRSGQLVSRLTTSRDLAATDENPGSYLTPAGAPALNYGYIIQINEDSGAADFTVTKGGPDTAQVGSTVRFSVTIANAADTSLHLTSITDSVFGDVRTTHGDVVDTTCDELTFVNHGQQASCAFDAVVRGQAGSTHRDRVTVVAGGESVQSNEVAVALTAPPAEAAIGLTKTFAPARSTDADGSQSWTIGDTVAFDIVVSNVGDLPLSGIVLEDDAADELSCRGLDHAGGFELDVDETASCVAKHRVVEADATAGTFRNTAWVSTDQDVSATAEASVEIAAATPRLELSAALVEPGPFRLGETVRVAISVRNSGATTLTNVKIQEITKLGLSEVVPSLAPGATWSLPAPAPYTVVAVDAAAKSVSFAVIAKSDQTGPTQRDLVAAVVNPLISISNVASAAATTVGSTATFTVTVRNGGDVALTSVVVTDNVSGLDETIASLAVGESKVFTRTVTAQSSQVATGIASTASAKAAETATVTASASVRVSAAAAAATVVTARRSLPVTGRSALEPLLWWAAALVAAGTSLLSGSGSRHRPRRVRG